MESSCEHTKSTSEWRRVKVNVGGKVFETTSATLQSTESPTTTTTEEEEGMFMDGDPMVFSCILSLLRTKNHKYKYKGKMIPTLDQLVEESQLYGLDISPYVSPPPFSPLDASLVTSLTPPPSSSLPAVSAFSASNPNPNSNSIVVAHSGNISCYHPVTLSFQSTFPTHVHHISSVSSVSADVVALGSQSSAGLHFYATPTGLHLATVLWLDPSDTRLDKSRVTALANSDSPLFSAAFQSKHGENAVLLIDKHTLTVVSEIGRQSGNSSKASAINKMRWVPSLGLLVGSSITSGAFGYSGYVRLWDPRSGQMIWDAHEPGGSTTRLGDTMADIDVDPHSLFLAKLGSKSGDLGVAHLRKLGPPSHSDPWVYLEDPNPGFSANWKPGSSVLLHCYQGDVFVARDGELEAWSTMEEEHSTGMGKYRRIFVDKLEDSRRGIITNIQRAGNRLFLTRDTLPAVEVWETSPSSALHTLV